VPLVRISLPQHITAAQARHISDAVHDSMVSSFNVPADDRFQILSRHAPGELVCTPAYLGIAHADALVFIQITCNEGRTLDMKKALFARIAGSIAEGGAVLASDVIVNLVEVKKENWSFGNGIAQYAV